MEKDYAQAEHNESRMPAAGESTEDMSAGRYIATRISTLKPPMDKVQNPITLLRMLNTQQWLFFFVAFFAWSWDAFDFFSVSLTVSELATSFKVNTTDITWGMLDCLYME